MKTTSIYLTFVLCVTMLACKKQTQIQYKSLDDYPVYSGENLWVDYTSEATNFKIWTPPATAVRINLYENGTDGNAYLTKDLKSDQEGIWSIELKEDLKGKYYTFQVQINDEWLAETPGIYAVAVGVNGKRAMVLDLNDTDPEGWEDDKRLPVDKPNEAIIYELHVRDMTIHPNANSTSPGKYLGLIEENVTGPEGIKTGIDHLKELGITHVHLLPSYDHYSIDESNLDSAQFNWGYDPQNYNVPEGSFSSDPYNAEVRIKEFKQMVKAFHDNGIGVILDVVYNHTGRTEGSNFNLETPGYYYRQREDGTWSDASACGNETSSDRPMTRKFIKESVLYWAREYHLDGFRFDLMGIHDITTMNKIASSLKALDPSIFVYGEGWTAGSTPLPEEQQAIKKNTYRMPLISAFSDDVRDGIKGSVFEDKSTGFVSGAKDTEESIKFGVVGSIFHESIDYMQVNYSDTAWSKEPWQAISYVSCHDNHTLFDKLSISRPDASADEIKAMHKLANAIVLTTQGTPFLHAGVEMMRTKGGEHNSYNKPDDINQIDWNWKVTNRDVFNYYQSLIALRKAHPAFFMPTADMVRENLSFVKSEPGLIGFQISNNANDDSWKDILIYYNAKTQEANIDLDGQWQIAVQGDQIDANGLSTATNSAIIPATSMFIAFKK
jgi:pullulanase